MREWRQAGTANGELETKTNTATNEEWLFQYDALGNLVSVGLPNGDLVEYLVDGLGRQVGKKKNGVLLKQWIYRDALKPVAELDGAGNLVAQFAYGSKRNVPDYVFRGGATYRVVSDHLGSPTYAVNMANSADVPFTATYTTFGEMTGTGLEWMPFGFAGGHWDEDSRLVRFGARDYDPLVGRWTSRDPGRWSVGDLNLYLYSYGDPINFIDSDGRNPVLVSIAIAVILFGDTGCTGTRCADLAKAENDEKNACRNIGGNPPDSGGLLGPDESAPTPDEAEQVKACTDARKSTAIARAKCAATQGR